MQVQTGAQRPGPRRRRREHEPGRVLRDDLRWGAKADSVELDDRLARGRVTAGGEHHPVPGGMIETAENLRREYAICREEQDELALRSHQPRRRRAAERARSPRRSSR